MKRIPKGSSKGGQFAPDPKKSSANLGLFKRKNKSLPEPKNDGSHVDAVYNKYRKHWEDMPEKIACSSCGSRNIKILMKEPDGKLSCGRCTKGGSADNTIEVGPWIAPSSDEIYQAKKKDKAKKKKINLSE